MSLSNYLENALVNHVCGGTTFTQPAAIYVKLHIGDPGEDCTANPAGNTTRQVITFGAASGGTATSSNTPSWTSVGTAETYTHASLWDASTAGNPLGSGALGASVAVLATDNFTMSTTTFAID